MLNSQGIFIEGITKAELVEMFASVMEVMQQRLSKREYTINELSGMTGYSPAHLRKIIKDNNIVYRKTGREIFVPHEMLSHVPHKNKRNILLTKPPGVIPD